jgi:8-oxo-dGTP pyrophosphatase MutT (NUDIX family)
MRNQIEFLARGVCLAEGRLLLCRNRAKGNVYLPGGHIEFGESAAGALARELKEETGRKAAAGRFLGAIEHTYAAGGERTCEINVVFELRIDDADPAVQPESLEPDLEFYWCVLDELRDSSLEPYPLRECIPAWIGQRHAIPPWASTYPGR